MLGNQTASNGEKSRLYIFIAPRPLVSADLIPSLFLQGRVNHLTIWFDHF